MHVLIVRLTVKQDHIDDFIKASIADGSNSLQNEPGCHRFDIIQDETNPKLFGFTEEYSDEAAFEHHKTTPHFVQWDAAVKNMLDGSFEVSFCRPVFPLGDATWDARRSGAVEDPAFGTACTSSTPRCPSNRTRWTPSSRRSGLMGWARPMRSLVA